jgi:microcystin-dependent protein
MTWDGSNWVAVPPAVKSVYHDNMQPWLGINYIIALYGIYPSRSSISDPTMAEISLFAGNFAPRNWAYCDGQLQAISQNTALFSLLGTTYGGDGVTTFALPDLRGRVPVHPGSGPGLSPRTLGGKGGVESLSH